MNAKSRSALEAANPTTPGAAPPARRRRRRLVRSAVIALVAAVVLIPAALLIATLIADAPLPESVKAPPQALREHLKNDPLLRAGPNPHVPFSRGPVFAALELPDESEFREQIQAGFFNDDSTFSNLHRKSPAEVAAFLDSRRDLLERFYLWAEKGGKLTPPDFGAGVWLVQMAIADADRDWREGRPDKTVRIVLALLKLFDSTDSLPFEKNCTAIPTETRSLGWMLRQWFESGGVPAESISSLQQSLARMAKREFDDIQDEEPYWQNYAAQRKAVVQILEAPWFSTYYTSGGMDRARYFKIGGFELPNPWKYGLKIANAVDARYHAAEILKEWDDWNQQEIEFAKTEPPARLREYRKAPSFRRVELGNAHASYLKSSGIDVYFPYAIFRAGLTVLANPAARPPESIDLRTDPNNLWRDPVTDAPFQVIEREDLIAIFSSGMIGRGTDLNSIGLEDLEREAGALLLPSLESRPALGGQPQ